MHIVTIASEAIPFVKTGGLADVVGTLYKALARDHRMTLIMPYYKSPEASFPQGRRGERYGVLIGAQNHEAHIHRHRVGHNQELILIEHDLFFHRPGIYGLEGHDYPDNFHRFYFFCNAAAQWLSRHSAEIDVVHCHDWQCGLVPMLLGTGSARRLPTLFTIHNISFQGRFPECSFALTHLPRHLFNPEGVEFYGELNFMKGGIRFSDRVNTVSPSYAGEIQTEEYGVGLDGLLRSRSQWLTGILNGIDVEEWNPATDPNIEHPFEGDIEAWKGRCREALRRELELPQDDSIPLFVMIGRLTHQKGVDLVLELWETRPPKGQLVVLGTGDPEAQRRFERLAIQHNGVRMINRFSETMAHRLQAAADFFLMPSRFEPCGLTQMVAQRYGTLPLVTLTGGLRDTVVPIGSGAGATGIAIHTPDVAGVGSAIAQALMLYQDRETALAMRRRAMERDFSWARSSAQYQALYGAMVQKTDGKRGQLV